MCWACGTRGFGARALSLPCSGTVPATNCPSPSAETQGVFVWVIAAESSKGCGPEQTAGVTGRVVGQVDGDSCGQSSLSVWVGEGELAFVP